MANHFYNHLSHFSSSSICWFLVSSTALLCNLLQIVVGFFECWLDKLINLKTSLLENCDEHLIFFHTFFLLFNNESFKGALCSLGEYILIRKERNLH